jgi:hypothetical protein
MVKVTFKTRLGICNEFFTDKPSAQLFVSHIHNTFGYAAIVSESDGLGYFTNERSAIRTIRHNVNFVTYFMVADNE